MKTQRQIYEDMYREIMEWHKEKAIPKILTYDQASRQANLHAVKNTVLVWKLQFTNKPIHTFGLQESS